MGNQNPHTSEYFFQKYQLISQTPEKNLSIWQQKKTDNQFIVKQLIFTIKQQFQTKLLQFNHLQQIQQCENILKLRKVWSQQHNGFCSSTYKIYCMYQYSSIILQQQIEARRSQNRNFEQQQLLGIIQTCLNSLNTQNSLLFSPQQIYVSSDGLLKIINSDIYDYERLNIFHSQTYYSPQKIQNFSSNPPNDEQFIKQSIFSLGMTLLHCITLEKQFTIYNPLQTVKSKRFNKTILHNLISSLDKKNAINHKLLCLIESMISYQKNNRPSILNIQQQLNQISAQNSIDESLQQQNRQQVIEQNQKINKDEQKLLTEKAEVQKNSIFKDDNISNIFFTNQKNINKFITDNSQLQILKQISSNNNLNILNSNNSNNINQKKKQIYIEDNTFILNDLPDPISKQNSLFTNPQFIKKIRQDLNYNKSMKSSMRSSQFTLTTKNNPVQKSIQQQNNNQFDYNYFASHKLTESKSLSIFHQVELNVLQNNNK